ncbi:hypothetical protein QC762_0105980 [Podospora pseudocomata]|uniref:Uncharacterized protein n=1 Tax=Podospora pseudocomata TaxID=2093779 RepID=A0ABR0G2T2_9PEZI|nr:hypothetical protein QC762_0105980 [Podospora pseudocomata]
MPPLPRNMGAVILSWDFDDYGQKARRLGSVINLFLTHIKFEDPQLSRLGNTTPPLKHLGYQTNKRPYGEDFVVYATPLIVTPSNACS